MKKLIAVVVIACLALLGWKWLEFHWLDAGSVRSDLARLPVDDLVDHETLSEDRIQERLAKAVAAQGMQAGTPQLEPIAMLCKPNQRNLAPERLTQFHVSVPLSRSWLGLTFSERLDMTIVDRCLDGALVRADDDQ